MSRFAQQNEFQVEPGLRVAVDSVVSVGVVSGWLDSDSFIPLFGLRYFSYQREAIQLILHGGGIASEIRGWVCSVGLR